MKMYMVYVALASCCLFLFISLRYHTSTTILAMTEQNKMCLDANNHHPNDPVFTWGKYERNLILASPYFGQLVSQIPGGWLADRYGGKWVLGIGILIGSIATAVTPLVASEHIASMIAIGVAIGMGTGITMPAINNLSVKWIPEQRLSTYYSIISTGHELSFIVIPPTVAVLSCSRHLGWPSVFYMLGGVGILWFLLWSALMSSSPQSSKWISDDEISFIKGSTSTGHRPTATPWRRMLTSRIVWVLTFTHFCHDLILVTIALELPLFYNDILHVDLNKNSLFTSLPYGISIIVVYCVGYATDRGIEMDYITKTNARKMICAGSLIPSSLLFVIATYVSDSEVATVTCTSVATTLLMCQRCGLYVTFLDVSPNFTGSIVAVSGMFGITAMLVQPIILGSVLEEHSKGREEYRFVYACAAGVALLGSFVFVIFGTAERQPWDSESDQLEDFAQESMERAPMLQFAHGTECSE